MKYVPPVGGGANDPYVDGNPASGVEGSAVPAAAVEHPMREILAVILAAGLVPSENDLAQLLAALRAEGVFQTAARFNNTTKVATTAFLKARGHDFSAIKNFSAAGALDASYMGALTLFSGTTFAAMIPAANSVPAGSALEFVSIASGTVSVNRSGADNFTSRGTNLTSISLNSGDSLRLVSDGINTWYASGTAVSAIGIGQTWNDYTASRALNTTYTNTTGKPIMVAVNAINSVTNSTVGLSLTVGGITSIGYTTRIAGNAGADVLSAVAIVPPGATYSAVATQASLNKWTEIR